MTVPRGTSSVYTYYNKVVYNYTKNTMKIILNKLKVSFRNFLNAFNLKRKFEAYIARVASAMELDELKMEEIAHDAVNCRLSDCEYEIEDIRSDVDTIKSDLKDDIMSDIDDKFDDIAENNSDEVRAWAREEAEEYFDNEISYHVNDLEDAIRDVSRDLDIEARDLRNEMKDVEASIDSLDLENTIKDMVSKQYVVQVTLKPKE